MFLIYLVIGIFIVIASLICFIYSGKDINNYNKLKMEGIIFFIAGILTIAVSFIPNLFLVGLILGSFFVILSILIWYLAKIKPEYGFKSEGVISLFIFAILIFMNTLI